MNYLQNILPDNLTYALGWTVVHSLWQGIIIAAIMALILATFKNKTANWRFWIANTALLLMGISSAFTLYWLLGKQAKTFENTSNMLILLRGGMNTQSLENQNLITSISLFFNQHLALIVLIWFMGVAFFALRLMGGLMYIEILKTRHVMPLTDEWMARMNGFKNSLGIQKTIALMESALVGVPMTIGWLKPIILLPIGTINGMTVAQVEAILAHELSHIQAKDYILNICQTLIEILFYYHPAVWWISANIRAERENRCDDVAVKLCGNSLIYAKALLALQEMQHQNIRTYGLAMTFSNKRKGILLKRVKRILNQPQNRSNIMEKFAATGLLLVVIVALAFADQPNNQNQTTKDKTEKLVPPSVNERIFKGYEDTIPKRKGEITIQHEDNGKSVELKMKDGEITRLKIDGQEIPKSDYKKYEDVTEDLIYNLPTPPSPPPMPPTSPSAPPPPPMPPTPPSYFGVPVPPKPPTPPTPPTPPSRQRFGIIKEKDKNGSTVLKLGEGDGEIAQITIKDGEVYVDGEKLENRKDLTLKSPRFYMFNGSEFDDILDFKNLKDLNKSFKSFKWHDSDTFLLNGDSLKMGSLDWDDSSSVFRLKDKLKYRFYYDNENSKRMLKNLGQQSERMRENMRQLTEKNRLLYRKNSERIRKDAERIRQNAQRLAREYSSEYREKARELRNKYPEKRDIWRAEMEAELTKDGVIKEGEKMTKFEINRNSKEVNGKKIPKELQDKYDKMFEKFIGSEVKGLTRYYFRFDNGDE